MKNKVAILLLCGTTLVATISALAICHYGPVTSTPGNAEQILVLNGEVRSIDLGAGTVRIENEEIPDYVPATTMPFTVKNPTMLKGLAAGAQVQFELVLTEGDSWISRIQKIAEDPASAASSDEFGPVHEGELLQVATRFPISR